MSIDHTTGTHESVEAAVSFIPSGTTHLSREFSSRRLGVKMPFGDYLPPRKRGRVNYSVPLLKSTLSAVSVVFSRRLVRAGNTPPSSRNLSTIKVGVIMFVAIQTTGVINQALAKVTAVKSGVRCSNVKHPTNKHRATVPDRLGCWSRKRGG